MFIRRHGLILGPENELPLSNLHAIVSKVAGGLAPIKHIVVHSCLHQRRMPGRASDGYDSTGQDNPDI